MATDFFTKFFSKIYQPLQQKLKLGLWAFHVKTLALYWSEGVFDIHETSPEEYHPTVESAVNFYAHKDRDRLQSVLDRLSAQAGEFVGDFSLYTAKGIERHVRVLAYRTTEGPDSDYVFGIIQDIHESVLRSLESEMLAAVARNTNEGILITDPFGNTIWANEGMSRLSGFELAEMWGKRPGDMFQGPETDQRTVRQIRKAIKDRQPIRTEILNYHKHGGTYWLMLDIHPHYSATGELLYFVAVESDITHVRKRESELNKKVISSESEKAELQNQVFTDELTGIGNRRHFFEVWKQYEGSRRHLSLISLDIDHFKDVNDSYGHDAGDKVLIQMTHNIQTLLRREDSVYRMGGEEFIVICPSNLKTAVLIAERLRSYQEKHPVQIDAGQSVEVTISLGVAQWLNSDQSNQESLEQLIKRADSLLYEAKRSGRNRVCH